MIKNYAYKTKIFCFDGLCSWFLYSLEYNWAFLLSQRGGIVGSSMCILAFWLNFYLRKKSRYLVNSSVFTVILPVMSVTKWERMILKYLKLFKSFIYMYLIRGTFKWGSGGKFMHSSLSYVYPLSATDHICNLYYI